MLSLKTLPYLHRPSSPFKSLRFPSSSPSPPSSLSFSFSSSTTTMAAGISTVEHVVLFKVRDSTDPSKIDAMISHLRSLVSLPGVAHLSAGPVLRNRSAAATFTHLLHSRYASKSELAAYGSDPTHLAVVKDLVLPICDDILAFDWVAAGIAPAPLTPGSAARLTLAKPTAESSSAEVLEVVASAKDKVAGPVEVSLGENFSPARAKGYEIGMLAVFPGVGELDGMDKGEVDAVKEKVQPLLESVIVVDFVVPPPPSSNL
ncbi:stress-response A/B barrel domain-containing protein UP3-like [Typha angustifolia]|uniref:stress-response A/B barrel domain-containing protein UP3-like n=1 Tax=Typha angustifolia TaxID=59011 RepID=UPI003C2C44B5